MSWTDLLPWLGLAALAFGAATYADRAGNDDAAGASADPTADAPAALPVPDPAQAPR